jgi:hypothetical protein
MTHKIITTILAIGLMISFCLQFKQKKENVKSKVAIYLDNTVYFDEPTSFYYAVDIFNEDTVIMSYDLNNILIGLKNYEIVGIFDLTCK